MSDDLENCLLLMELSVRDMHEALGNYKTPHVRSARKLMQAGRYLRTRCDILDLLNATAKGQVAAMAKVRASAAAVADLAYQLRWSCRRDAADLANQIRPLVVGVQDAVAELRKATPGIAGASSVPPYQPNRSRPS